MAEFNGILYAAPPPPGVTPDQNAPNNAHGLVVSVCVLLPLTSIFTGCRIWTRWAKNQHGLDDWLMEAAAGLNIAMCAIVLDMLPRGMGQHIWDVPLSKLYPGFMLRNIIIAALFCLATAIAKLSILAMYLRIFTSTAKKFRIAVFIAAGLIAGFGLSTFLVNVFSCSPVQSSWDIALVANARCINRPAFYLAQAGLSIGFDIICVIIPIPAIVGLRMGTKQKISVILLLSLGGSVCIISMIRLKSLIDMLGTGDLTRVTPAALMWCVIELNLSIIGGDMPSLKPLFVKAMPFLVSKSADSAPYGSSYQTHPQKSNISKTVTVTVNRNAETDSVEELMDMRGQAQAHDSRWARV